MLKIRLSIVLSAVIYIVACSPSGENITLPFEPEEVRNVLPAALERDGLWFKRVSDREFTFLKKDIPRVLEIGEEISSSFLPSERSFSCEGDYCEIFLRRINEAGVPYEIVKFMEIDWIVWEEKDAEEIARIEEAAMEEFANALSNKPFQTDAAKPRG
jgi:hypothetical protein